MRNAIVNATATFCALALTAMMASPAAARQNTVNRGEYLATGIARTGDFRAICVCLTTMVSSGCTLAFGASDLWPALFPH